MKILRTLGLRSKSHSAPRGGRNEAWSWLGSVVISSGLICLLAACSMTTSPLHSFIQAGDERAALSMISKGDAVNDRDQMGYTPLHLAAIKGNQAIAHALVTQGADINARDFYGRTPFMLALREGHIELARYFLHQGTHLKTHYTLTNALFDAVTGGSREMTDYLLQHGFSVNTVNRANTSALHLAAAKGDRELVELFIRHGADLNLRDSNGWSPLHFAAAREFREVVRTLLEHGAQPTPLATDALGAYATGVAYEESAHRMTATAPEDAKLDFRTAAYHFAQSAIFYRNLSHGAHKRIEEQHARNAFAFVLGAFAMAVQPGTAMPTASDGTPHWYTPVVVPRGRVDSLEDAHAAYNGAEQDALAGEQRCRNAAAELGVQQ